MWANISVIRQDGCVSSLSKYILTQSLAPLAVITASLTLVVWTTQSLQRVDLIIDDGSNIGEFVFLSLLIAPSLLAIILPFALFTAALYALYRLHSDSEIAVMFAAGASRWRIAAPLIALSLAGAAATLYLNTQLSPACYRILKAHVAELRSDIAANLIRSGEFVSPADHITVYAEHAAGGGRYSGLLIDDRRNPAAARTYLAQRALLTEGERLHLAGGSVQTLDPATGEVTIVRFDETALDLSAMRKGGGPRRMESSERFVSELLAPDLSDPWERANASKLRAEGHARLSAPLYVTAFVLIALAALLTGPYSRRGYAMRIALAAAAVLATRVAGFAAQTAAADAPVLWWSIYAAPLAAIAACAALLSGLSAPAGRQKDTAGTEAGA